MPEPRKSLENIIPMILDVEPLVLEVGSGLFKGIKEGGSDPSLAERLHRLRSKTVLNLGVILPELSIRQNPGLEPGSFLIKVREVEVRRSAVSAALAPLGELEREISDVLTRYAHEFLGLDETQALVSHLRSTHPDLVGNVHPSLLTLPEIQRVLQNLLREGVPIRDLLKIFETLREYAIYTHDPDVLTEYARHALSRTIGSLYQKSFVLDAYLLDREIEELVAGAIRYEDGGFLEFDEKLAEKIVRILGKRFRKLDNQKKRHPVLLVSPEIRRFVRMLTERLAPEVPVLSTHEIAPEYKVRTLGVISLDAWPAGLKKIARWFRLGVSRQRFPGDELQKSLLVLNLMGPVSHQVVQCFSEHVREVLRGRAMLAPIPAKGKESVLSEFFSFLPKEKEITNLQSLIRAAAEDPVLLAEALEKHWLSGFSDGDEDAPPQPRMNPAPRGRDETNSSEKAAVFISGAARWVQDEVFRHLPVEDLRQIGAGMLQFPFISHEAKRKTWEDCESIVQKEEWWDPEALARFVQSCSQGRIEDFKKRGFRQSQKVAVLLLSLPSQRAKAVGKGVLEQLPKGQLGQLLAEMGQWRDHIPVETRVAAITDFLSYVASSETHDFEFFEDQIRAEVERIVHRDPSGAAAVVRNLWFAPPDPWSVFESLVLQMPNRVIHHLLRYLERPVRDRVFSNGEKAYLFVAGLHPDLRNGIKEKFSQRERGMLQLASHSDPVRKLLFREFLRAYYGGSHPTPLAFLKRN